MGLDATQLAHLADGEITFAGYRRQVSGSVTRLQHKLQPGLLVFVQA